MTAITLVSPKERILRAALALLEAEGLDAVSTRAVSAAADVQPPTIYRQFGDMRGLLNAVASAGFAAYLERKTTVDPRPDPVEELRAGWDTHVDFGLTHPHLYALMHATPWPEGEPAAAREAAALLRTLLKRVAETGQLALSVDRAAAMVHAAGVGVTLSLLHRQVRGDGLSTRMREAVLNAILAPGTQAVGDPPRQQAASHAVALLALLPEHGTSLSAAERALLVEWLGRLA